MRELCFLSVAEAAALIRKRDLSPVDLTRAHLSRIGSLDSRIRSYITVTSDIAEQQAKQAADEIARGRYRGPLHGIPLSYKDIIDTAGTRTTGASAIYADRIPERDAHVVSQLRKAGAIMLGKANTFEFAWASTTENDQFKPARNPWNTKFSPGGSSSGSAAGVAAGLAMASIGSDSGGSIRNPASLCGNTGLKPTFGRVGRTGVLPLSYSFDTVGSFTRTAEDASILLEALAGHDPGDPTSSREPVAQYRAALSRRLRGLRVGILPSYMDAVGAETEVTAAFNDAVTVFRSLGATVRELEIPHLIYSRVATWTILRIEGFSFHFKKLRNDRDKLGAGFFRNTAVGAYLSSQDYVRAHQARRLIAGELAKAFHDVDMLITPTRPRTASLSQPVKGPQEPRVVSGGEAYVTPFNVNGSPAVSIPCGFNSAGVPIGLQIAGKPFDEATILAAAHRYQMETDWHRRRPSPQS